jgi:hypothetical protein
MAKPKVSLEAMMAQTVATDALPSDHNVITSSRDNVKASRRLQHTSLYLTPEVRRAIKEIAFQFDKKPHDLYIEGIDLMLAKYGKPDTHTLGNI